MPSIRRTEKATDRHARLGAFALVEVMAVVAIIGFISGLSLPRVKKATDSSRAAAVANDLRVLAAALTGVAHQSGAYPPDQSRGTMPPALAGFTKPASWTAVTPVGGYYNWEPAQNRYGFKFKAGIGINSSGGKNVTTDAALLRSIDRLIDDGNLATGNFRLWDANEPLYVIEL